MQNKSIKPDFIKYVASVLTAYLLSIVISILFLSSAYASSEGPGVTPDEAFSLLKKGNERYYNGLSRHANLNKIRREATSQKGQHPYATIIGCSDSRVPIEHIFDSGIGELFIIRVAGNVCDTDEAGSIEYGVDHLSTPLFVVLGHSQCGAVTAVARGDEVHGNIPPLVDNILPAVKKAKKKHGDLFSAELLDSSIKNNVWQSIEDLFKISPVSAKRVAEGKLMVIGAVYHLDSGKVEWLGEHPGQKELMALYSSTGDKALHGKINRVLHTPEHNTSLIMVISVTALIITIILSATYLLFFRPSTRLKKIQIKGRISAGFISLIAASLASLLSMGIALSSQGNGVNALTAWVSVIFICISVFFSFLFLKSIITSFKKAMQALREMKGNES